MSRTARFPLFLLLFLLARPPAAAAQPREPENVSPELVKIYRYIDEHYDEHVASLQAWIRQRGISNTGEGMAEAARTVQGFFEDLGCQESRLYEVGTTEWGAPGHPVVYARCDAGAEKTLLVYWMYDTMPVFTPELWKAPPFEGRIVEQPPFPKVIVGRGAVNTKGPQMAELNALRSIKAVTGTLPVNLIFVAEGDEERMSIGLRKFMREHADLFADAEMVYRFGWQRFDGKGTIEGSSEGCVYFELETSGERWGRGPVRQNIHGGLKRVVDSPVWRHIKMLSTLVSEDGNRIRVTGWYDGVAGPSPEERRHLEEQAARLDLEAVKENLGVRHLIDDMSPVDYLERSRYGVSFNIDGIWAGNTNPGFAGSVLPYKVTSKHNCRYPPELDGMDLVRKLRAYLDGQGYPDVAIRVIGDVPWCKMNYHSEIGRAIMKMYEQWNVPYEIPPSTEVLSAPYWPAYLFGRDPLELPIAAGNLGYGGNAHTANEFYVIEGNGTVLGMREAEKGFATILYNLAGKNP